MKPAAREEEASTEKPFRFLDLPPEQRNHIYRYCLRPRDALIDLTERGGQAEPCTPLVRLTFVGRVGKAIRICAFNPFILQTCRTVNREASSILYGMNDFHLQHRYPSELPPGDTILSPKGRPIVHLRSLELGERWQREYYYVPVHSILARLQKAPNLERFCVSFTWIACFRSPETMAKAIIKLWKHLNRNRREEGLVELGIDFFSMREPVKGGPISGAQADFGPGGKHHLARFLPEFKTALEIMATEEQAKISRGNKEKA